MTGGSAAQDMTPLAQQAALLVAIIAGFLAIATFMANETVKEAITGETKAAETSARLEANDTKVSIAEANAVLLRVIGVDSTAEQAAVDKALQLEARIERELAPVDEKLADEIREDHAESAHANDLHLLYELSSTAMQIGIVLAGVAILARRRWLLGLSALAAGIGGVLLVAGFLS